MVDDFEKFCKGQDEVKLLELEQTIDNNEDEYGPSAFSESCREQLKKKGFLSSAQIERLKNGPTWDCRGFPTVNMYGEYE